MGQYYMICNTETMEYLNPLDYQNGLKLMETAWLKNDYIHVAIELLKYEWNGNKVISCGDYSDEYDIYFNTEKDLTTQILPPVPSEDEIENTINNYVLVNYSKKIYCDIDCNPIVDGWQINPLTLLICNVNHSGGSYYGESDKEKVGSWSHDRIGCLPKDCDDIKEYKKVTYQFKE